MSWVPAPGCSALGSDPRPTARWDGDLSRGDAADAITQVGLDYGLITAYTSFVAVDRSRVVGDGDPEALTQAVEIPEDTSTRDAAGISLAGTTGSESHYTIDTASVTDKSIVRVEEWVSETSFPHSLSGPTDWRSSAKLRIKQITVSEAISQRAVKRALKADIIKYEACYEQRVGTLGKQRLRFRLRFDARGELVAVDLIDGSLGTADADGCIKAVLLAAAWDGLANAAATVEIELQLVMR